MLENRVAACVPPSKDHACSRKSLPLSRVGRARQLGNLLVQAALAGRWTAMTNIKSSCQGKRGPDSSLSPKADIATGSTLFG